MRPHRTRALAAALVALSSLACTNPFYQDPQIPLHPGDLVVEIRDTSAQPVEGVYVSVVCPNKVGSFFTVATRTRQDGTVTFRAIEAGLRPVEVMPPVGYSVIGPARREVEIVENRTVRAVFVFAPGTGADEPR